MMARVLAALLLTDRQTMTAGESSDHLQANSGAISGPVKMLTSVVGRLCAYACQGRRMGYAVHQPERSDLGDAGDRRRRDRQCWTESIAGQRLTQMHDCYAFLVEEIPALVKRRHDKSP
jgi:hypothetical protein